MQNHLISDICAFVFISSVSLAAPVKLNNFVTQLLDVGQPASGSQRFVVDRDGWLLVRIQGSGSVDLDGRTLSLQSVQVNGVEWHERMMQVASGAHRVDLTGQEIRRLQVRRVPEIRYCKFQYDPWVHNYGPYDWVFMQKHVLPHVNTIVGMAGQDQAEFAVPWRSSGGKWVVEAWAPGLRENPPPPPDPSDARRRMIANGDLERPWVDGAMLDEYYHLVAPVFPFTLAGLRSVREDAALRTKSLEPYLTGDPEKMANFIRDAAAISDRIFIEIYNTEQPTEQAANEYLKKRIVEHILRHRAIAGQEREHVFGICLGKMSGPPESLNTQPGANYRVFQDMEFNLLANSAEIGYVDAMMEWTSGYAEEETTRWLSQLHRHYCLEGNTARLSDEPYELTHVINPDFVDGVRGWKIEPAAERSVRFETHEGYGALEGRFGADNVGDQFMVMTRQIDKPNYIRQTVQNLTPGTTYALRLYSTSLQQRPASFGNPSLDDLTHLGIRIEGAEVLEEREFNHTYRSMMRRNLKADAALFFTYHLRLFRASSDHVELTISDWENHLRSGGNARRDVGVNFVEVQPYFMP